MLSPRVILCTMSCSTRPSETCDLFVPARMRHWHDTTAGEPGRMIGHAQGGNVGPRDPAALAGPGQHPGHDTDAAGHAAAAGKRPDAPGSWRPPRPRRWPWHRPGSAPHQRRYRPTEEDLPEKISKRSICTCRCPCMCNAYQSTSSGIKRPIAWSEQQEEGDAGLLICTCSSKNTLCDAGMLM